MGVIPVLLYTRSTIRRKLKMHCQTESGNTRLLQNEMRIRPIVKIRFRRKVTFLPQYPIFTLESEQMQRNSVTGSVQRP